MQEYLYNLATDKYKGPVAGSIKALLFILSCVYGLLVRVSIFANHFKRCSLKCRVISVGNITLGGTGKTSLVEYIARFLKLEGHKVAILSRGYKRKAVSCQLSAVNCEAMGDEPYMLAKNLGDIPVIVDADRVRGARCAIKDYGVDTVILDDGFQQWKIKKDLEIVTIDATEPFGNRYLIPRGILREPLSSLERADMLVLTKTNLNPDVTDIRDFLNRVNSQAVVFESMHKPAAVYQMGNPDKRLNTETLLPKTVTLFSGIADPDSFENLILSLGLDIGLSFKFSDHYNYSQKDLDKIVRASKEEKIDTIITTEKDAARLHSLPMDSYSLNILVLRVNLQIKNEEGFRKRLLRIYSA